MGALDTIKFAEVFQMSEAVLFDMDGVIVDSEPLHKQTSVEVMREYGVEITRKDIDDCKGRTLDEDAELLLSRYNIPLSEKENFKRKKEEQTIKLIRERAQIFPGVMELLENLSKHGMKLALCSSSLRSEINAVLEVLGLSGFFDVIVSGAEIEKGKPAPDIFLEATKQLNVSPKNCLVIEDTIFGVRAAKSAGAKCLAVTNTFKAETLLSAGADYILDSLENIIYEVHLR